MRLRHPLTQRRLCGLLVMVWLFAVLLGAARACLTLAPLPAQVGTMAPPSLHAHHAAHDPAAHAAHAHHHGSPQLATAAPDLPAAAHAHCAKFCDEEGQSLTQAKGLELPDHLPVTLPAQPYHPWVALNAPLAWRTGWQHGRRAAHGPPLRLQLQRLAL